MARPQETFNKREQEKLRAQKRKEKQEKKEARKANPKLSGEDLYVYVDENGHLTSTPPDPSKKIEIDVESIEIGVSRRTESDEAPVERRGTIDFFNESKGFGFIKEVETGEKYFVHISGLIDKVKEGNLVTYDLEKGAKGMNAVNVKKI
ncbi:cold shock domain-containing protein [Flavobacterium sp. HXWNR69]|uniref:Cold shock domain-containing protein n=1 Tax=Flavobacterium fragile TaxID=2949085 RepID=A0ABT0TFL0_9FLAO|nr:cold shock domain-containing protein [Flavobacterium sp. HXWNR69]MCL9769774.1 cold shock domain-containing protein [Flavobacterium sp. HXWNR69]